MVNSVSGITERRKFGLVQTWVTLGGVKPWATSAAKSFSAIAYGQTNPAIDREKCYPGSERLEPGRKFLRDRAVRHPTEIPRKQAIKTTLVKKVRRMTVLPNQRIQASSWNSARKEMRNKSTCRRPIRASQDIGFGDPLGF